MVSVHPVEHHMGFIRCNELFGLATVAAVDIFCPDVAEAARLSGGEQPPVLPLSHMGHFSALPGLENKKRDRRQRAGQRPSPHPIPQHLGGVWGWGRQPGSNHSPPGHRGRVPPNPCRPGTWGLREATPKEHHGAEGGRYRQPQLIFPPFPLSPEEILFQGRSKGASDLCRGRLAAL